MIRLVADGLATYRATRLIREDKILDPIREPFLDRYDPESTRLGYLLTCPWCISIWVGLAVAAAHRLAPRAADLLVETLASSAVAGVLSGAVERLE